LLALSLNSRTVEQHKYGCKDTKTRENRSV
jgi:hypothetical protein